MALGERADLVIIRGMSPLTADGAEQVAVVIQDQSRRRHRHHAALRQPCSRR